MKKIIIITDAWKPQINGVVRAIEKTSEELKKMGHEIVVIEPSPFKAIPTPLYKEIPFVYGGLGNIGQYLQPPCCIHICTEGGLGLAFNYYCTRNSIPFTTSYHTNYPDYLKRYIGLPKALSYAFLRYFHNKAKAIMVATQTLEDKLTKKGFKNLTRWSFGVDTDLFRPYSKKDKRLRPICTYVGRVSKEKNLEAFLDIDLDVDKVVVGHGPYMPYLKDKYGTNPNIHFRGVLGGEELAKAYAISDCFVFPSKTDTFGLVLLEALACGVPIAAYKVEGPMDIWDGRLSTGYLHERDLTQAIKEALYWGNPHDCRCLAIKYSWRESAIQFLDGLIEYTGQNEEILSRYH